MSGNHRTPILLCSLHHISGERHKKQRKCGNFGENFAWNLHFLVKLWISHNGDYWHWSVVCVLCFTMPLLGSTRPVIVQMVVKNTPYWLLSTMNIYIHTSPNSRVICHDIQCHDSTCNDIIFHYVMTSYIMMLYEMTSYVVMAYVMTSYVMISYVITSYVMMLYVMALYVMAYCVICHGVICHGILCHMSLYHMS